MERYSVGDWIVVQQPRDRLSVQVEVFGPFSEDEARQWQEGRSDTHRYRYTVTQLLLPFGTVA
jgi:hypothetical protein